MRPKELKKKRENQEILNDLSDEDMEALKFDDLYVAM
jgi:hypothetical protein